MPDRITLMGLGFTKGQIDEAEARVARINGWACPECGIHGGTYHRADCRFIKSQAHYDAIQDELHR